MLINVHQGIVITRHARDDHAGLAPSAAAACPSASDAATGRLLPPPLVADGCAWVGADTVGTLPPELGVHTRAFAGAACASPARLTAAKHSARCTRACATPRSPTSATTGAYLDHSHDWSRQPGAVASKHGTTTLRSAGSSAAGARAVLASTARPPARPPGAPRRRGSRAAARPGPAAAATSAPAGTCGAQGGEGRKQ
jgi:hypothetical protein